MEAESDAAPSAARNHVAISSQGALLGQHELSIQTLLGDRQVLSDQIARLSKINDRLNEFNSSSTACLSSPSPSFSVVLKVLCFSGCLSGPSKRLGSLIGVGILESQNHSPTSQNLRLQLPATLCTPQLSLPISALVDSGAEGNFLDHELAAQAGFLSEPLPEPITARALDGRILAHVTHTTVPLELLISGNHHDKISFNLISAPRTPVILGYPWLKHQNPH